MEFPSHEIGFSSQRPEYGICDRLFRAMWRSTEEARKPATETFPPQRLFPNNALKITITKEGQLTTTTFNLHEASTAPVARDPDIVGQFLIVEGDKSVRGNLKRHFGLDMPSSFETHFQTSDSLASAQMDPEVSTAFFARWLAVATQKEEAYRITERIDTNKPYDVETIDDPMNLHLDHDRYYNWPATPWRQYDPISISKEKETFFHAAKQCISFYSDVGDIFDAVLLVDPLRKHRILTVRFGFWTAAIKKPQVERLADCFSEETRPMDRLLNELMRYDGKLLAQNPITAFKHVVASFICGDLSGVLVEMSCTMDVIERALAKDDVLQSSMTLWRDMLGRWRNILFHQSTSLAYLLESSISGIEVTGSAGNKAQHGVSLKKRISRLQEDLERTTRRIETTFQAMMSTMSIVESERAITEAEAVSKLTYLAFFFIPLSLIAGVFGMNVVEFSNKLTWWLWVSVSIATTCFTYLALYWREFFRGIRRLPTLIKNLSLKRLSKVAFQWLRISLSVLSFVSSPTFTSRDEMAAQVTHDTIDSCRFSQLILSLVTTGLSAAVVAKRDHNEIAIVHLCLSVVAIAILVPLRSANKGAIFGILLVFLVDCGLLAALILLVSDPRLRQEINGTSGTSSKIPLNSGPFLGIIIMDSLNIFSGVVMVITVLRLFTNW